MKNALFSIIVAVAALATNAATTATQPWVLNRIADATNALPSPDVSGQLGAFASTGMVRLASSVGNAETWTDATGCVWRVGRETRGGYGTGVASMSYSGFTGDGRMPWVDTCVYFRGQAVGAYRWRNPSAANQGLFLLFDSEYSLWNLMMGSPQGATNIGTADGSVSDTVVNVGAYTFRIAYDFGEFDVTNLVGRVALTNDIPSNPGDIGAAPASVADTVQAWQTYWDGDDVRVTVTNYYGSEDLPHLYIEQKMPADDTHDAAWFKTIWDETTRHQHIIQRIAAAESALAEKADRAWGFYDSHTGEYSPDGYTQISSSNILIAAGMAYQKTITTDGEVWVLTATEPTTISGVTSNGFFRITDGDGNALFEIVKGDKRTVGATAGGIRVDGDEVQIDYMLTDNSSAEIRRTTDLRSGAWETVDATWTGASGAYTAHVAKPSGPRAFFKATYEVGGETYIRNSVPVGFERVYIGGQSYRVAVETVNGKKLMVLYND